MKRFLIFFVVSAMVCSLHADTTGSESASEVILDIYNSCVSKYSFTCVKPKALSWISQAVNQDVIKVTNDLSIVKTGDNEPSDANDERSQSPTVDLFNKIDSFLSTHTLKVEVPELLKTKEAREAVPESYLKGGLAEGLQVPLVAGNVAEGKFIFTSFSFFYFIKFFINFFSRSRFHQEGHDSIYAWIKIQDNCNGTISSSSNCN